VIVCATGFDAMTGPLLRMNVTTTRGNKLAESWEAGPRTYVKTNCFVCFTFPT